MKYKSVWLVIILGFFGFFLMIIFPSVQLNNALIVLFTAILVAATIYYATVTKKILIETETTSKTMEQTMMHQALIELQKDYRSPEMLHSIRSLWDFYDECLQEIKEEEKGEINTLEKRVNNKIRIKIKEKYENKLNEDKNRVNFFKYDPIRESEAIKNTFDAKRRKVSYFYSHLYDLRNSKILKGTVGKDFWTDSSKDTVNLILIPLEEKLEEQVDLRRPSHKPKFSTLKKLRNMDSVFENKK